MRLLLAASAALALTAAPARASQITMDFNGSSFAGPFSGSLTWDTADQPYLAVPGLAFFHAVRETFTIESTSATIAHALIEMSNNQCGLDCSQMLIDFQFSSAIPLENCGGCALVGFIAALEGPHDLFSVSMLPQDVTFTGFLTRNVTNLQAPLVFQPAAAVPEPATLTLTMIGLAAVLARGRPETPRRRHAR
jgi:hypothetical protein